MAGLLTLHERLSGCVSKRQEAQGILHLGIK